MLLAAIDEQCRGTYDFIYLPIDFKASEFSGGLTLVYNIMVHNAHMYMRLLIAFLFLSSNWDLQHDLTEQMQCGLCIHQYDWSSTDHSIP